MASITERLAAAIAGVPFVQLPEGWEGGPINIPGLTGGLPLDEPWDTVASAPAPELAGKWTAAGTRAEVLELPDAAGEEIEASRVGGETSVRVDDEEAEVPVAIAALLDRRDGDVAIVAHRFADTVWVAEVYPL
jgi:hypothetical protein